MQTKTDGLCVRETFFGVVLISVPSLEDTLAF